MTFSLRKASFVCGAFACWGLVGCDTAETNALPTGEASSSSVAVTTETNSTEPKPSESKKTEPETTLPSNSAAKTAVAEVQSTAPTQSTTEAAKTEAKPAAAATTRATPTSAAPSTPPPAPDRPRVTSKVTARPGEMQEVTFDTIKLPLEKDQPFNRSLLTKEVMALDGQPIRIRGYILPSFQQTGITQFVLVRDNLQCCFGPGAALHDCIIVEMKPGKSADYTVRPVSVEGKFTLAELVNPDDGKHLAIYHLDGEKVQ